MLMMVSETITMYTITFIYLGVYVLLLSTDQIPIINTVIRNRGVACDVTRVLHHCVCCYKYRPRGRRGYEINNNRTGTNNGGKKAVSYAHVVNIYSMSRT